jgi:hypothetical protein
VGEGGGCDWREEVGWLGREVILHLLCGLLGFWESLLHLIPLFSESRKWLEGLTKGVSGRQPEPRSFHTLTPVGGSRLVLLGGRGVQNNHYNDVHIFDIGKCVQSFIDSPQG